MPSQQLLQNAYETTTEQGTKVATPFWSDPTAPNEYRSSRQSPSTGHPPHLVTRFDLPDLPQEPQTSVATEKLSNSLPQRHYQSEQVKNVSPHASSAQLESSFLNAIRKLNSSSFNSRSRPAIKSFSQKHQTQGIVLLIFFDTRVASQARDLFSQPGTFSSDIVADATDALSCTLTTLEVILELTGYSDHLAYMQSAFHLHVSEAGKSDDQLDDKTSLTSASEQGGHDLSLLKRFLGSFGALRLFAPAQESSGAENAQDCSHFIVDYYDLRDAKSAFVSLDERPLYGMQLRVSGVDILPPAQSPLAPPLPNAAAGPDTTTRVPFPTIDASHRHTQSEIHEAGQSVHNRERLLTMGAINSAVRPRSVSADTAESPLSMVPPADTSLGTNPGGAGPMYLYSSSTSIQVYAPPAESQYPYPSPAPATPFDIPTPFYAPANPVSSNHPYQHPQQFVFPYGNAFPQEGDVVRASDGSLHAVIRGSGSPMHVLVPFGPTNPINTGESWSESPPPRRGSADRNAQHQGRGVQSRRHDGPTRASTPAEIMGSHPAHSTSPQSQQHGHPSRPAPKNNALDIPTIEAGLDTRTTVMIRNIPNKMTNDDLIAYIDSVCPRRIDFLYLRMDFSNGCNVGYAFVNFIAVEDLMTFAKAKLGQKWNMFSSEKILEMSYADYQGKESQVEKFKNSSIMDEREEWRPKIFRSEPGPDQGLPEPFPAPTHLRRKQISSHNRAAALKGLANGCQWPSAKRIQHCQSRLLPGYATGHLPTTQADEDASSDLPFLWMDFTRIPIILVKFSRGGSYPINSGQCGVWSVPTSFEAAHAESKIEPMTPHAESANHPQRAQSFITKWRANINRVDAQANPTSPAFNSDLLEDSMNSASTLKPKQVAVAMLDHAMAKHRDRYESIFMKAVRSHITRCVDKGLNLLLLLLQFLAGAMLSFGGLLSEIISGGSAGINSANPGLVKIMGGFVFPVGLVMIVLQGQELLTSNMMVFPMGLIKGVIPWWSLPVNWIIVTFGNLVGSLFFAAILVRYSGIISTEPYLTYAKTFAMHKASDPAWHQIFLRGIGCNWLVSVAVWQAAGAKDTISKIFAIWIPIWIFVACGFDHVVANMFSVPLGIMFGADLTAAAYIRKSLIAAYLGNIVGALLVALPATYFYLRDYEAGGLRNAESGEAFNEMPTRHQHSQRNVPSSSEDVSTEDIEVRQKQ
ncbi:hypothetical protein EYR38_006933 [Pleurotus pulmonarius]|nr:hypothetical protein EYR38_006933 [Pleurotus pulmonarius]